MDKMNHGSDKMKHGKKEAWESSDSTFQDILGVLARGKWLIAITFVVVWAMSLVYLHFANPVYKATATVLINTRLSESSSFLEPARRGDNDKNITQNELEMLKSHTIAYEVARQLLEIKYSDSSSQQLLEILKSSPKGDSAPRILSPEEIITRLHDAVDEEVIPETDVIQIIAASKDAREAALLANTYAQTYSSRNLQTSRGKTRSFREFLEVQVRDKQRLLAQIEDSLQRYMQAHGIVSLDDESKKLIDQLSKLEAQRDEADVNIKSLSRSLATYEEQLPEQEKNVSKVIGEANDPYIRLLQEQIAKLEVQRDMTVAQNPAIEGSEIYGTKIKEIDGQIAALRSKLQQRTAEFLRSLIPGSQTNTETAGSLKQSKQKITEGKMDLQGLEVRKTALNTAIQEYDRQFSQIPAKSMTLARLQRSKQSVEKLFLAVQEKYNESTMTEQSEFGYIEVIDPAAVPLKPSSPKVLLILLFGAVTGLAAGTILVLIKERMDVRINSPEDLKKEGHTVLGTVIHAQDGIAKPGANPLFALASPFSSGAESYRHLRTNLRYAQRDQPFRALLVTSSKPQEGKTTVVSNLGIAFAQTGMSVLIVDADLRKPSLHPSFNASLEPGLSDFLEGKVPLQKVVQTIDLENLSLIGGGSVTLRPAELLGSDRMQQFVTQMKEKYDLVIIDSPPVLAGTDSTILSTLVDGVLMVVSAGDTRFTEFNQCIGELTDVRGEAPQIILNNFNLHRAYGLTYGRSGYGYYPYTRENHKQP